MEGGRKGRSGTGCLQRTLIHQGPAPPGAQTFCGCHCPLPRHLQAELLVQRMDKVALVQVGVRQGRRGGRSSGWWVREAGVPLLPFLAGVARGGWF